jgi:hypothetical protein
MLTHFKRKLQKASLESETSTTKFFHGFSLPTLTTTLLCDFVQKKVSNCVPSVSCVYIKKCQETLTWQILLTNSTMNSLTTVFLRRGVVVFCLFIFKIINLLFISKVKRVSLLPYILRQFSCFLDALNLSVSLQIFCETTNMMYCNCNAKENKV